VRLKPPQREESAPPAAPKLVSRRQPNAARTPERVPTAGGARGVDALSFFSLGHDDFAIIPLAGERAACLSQLSPAELSVLAELAAGRSNRQIATSRGTSLRTVTNQVSALFTKLGVRSRAELALSLSGPKPPPSSPKPPPSSPKPPPPSPKPRARRSSTVDPPATPVRSGKTKG
jgi:DNA-binding CsgD family transcriptional regulator